MGVRESLHGAWDRRTGLRTGAGGVAAWRRRSAAMMRFLLGPARLGPQPAVARCRLHRLLIKQRCRAARRRLHRLPARRAAGARADASPARARRPGRAGALGLAFSLVATVPEKVWFCTVKGAKPWERPTAADVRDRAQGGHTIWYDEPSLLQARPAWGAGAGSPRRRSGRRLGAFVTVWRGGVHRAGSRRLACRRGGRVPKP